MTTASVNKPAICRELGKANGDMLLHALETMHRLMGSNDADMAFKAAKAVLDLEKTRIRHGNSTVGQWLNHTVDDEREKLPHEEMRPEPVVAVEQEEHLTTDSPDDKLDKVVDEEWSEFEHHNPIDHTPHACHMEVGKRYQVPADVYRKEHLLIGSYG